MEDTALLLRKLNDRKEFLTENTIDYLLHQSQLIKKLTKDYEPTALFNIFRLVSLAEIPYVNRLSYTQTIIHFIDKHIATTAGFSYTGKIEDIVPCYNAMLLEAYVRLDKIDSPEVKNALDWIKQYQLFQRNKVTKWPYKGICKFGGCMKSTPCYIGIGKTVRALITYSEFTKTKDNKVEQLIEQGIAYMLKHHMYQRLSNSQPISKHITELMFPQAYMLSLTDLVYIANNRNLWPDQRTNALKALVASKMMQQRKWKIDYIYSHKGYKAFETRRTASLWIEYIFDDCPV